MTPTQPLLALLLAACWWSALGATTLSRPFEDGGPSATQLRDLLTSIDDRLRALDAFGSTAIKLARIDFALEQLARRAESVESKLDRLDAKLDIRSSDERGLARRVDALGEQLTVKAARLDAKVDGLDRDVDRDLHEIMDRAERCEGVGERLLAASGSLARRMDQLDGAVQRGFNATAAALEKSERATAESLDALLSALIDGHGKIDNLVTVEQRGRAGVDNLTAVLDRALSGHEARFRELDADVETYTRKVVHGIQELWKTSDDLRSELSSTLEQGGRTREVVRAEFRRLHEQVSPLPALSEEVARQVSDLAATVDASFATLLVAQNAFIDSCRRVQREETHVYDVLQQVVYEMRNRSAADVRRISEQLAAQAADFDRALARAVGDMRNGCAPTPQPEEHRPDAHQSNDTSTDDEYDFEAEPTANIGEYDEDYQLDFPETT